jgi:large subunit ribosomal protein L9
MDIILKHDVENLGSKHDIVSVRPGYARNFLIPQGYAVAATPSARKVVAEVIKQQAHKASKALEQARALGTRLETLTLSIGAKAGESGKIFGSVNTIQIAEALQRAGLDIDRKQIALVDEHIKELGAYEAKVKLHREVTAIVKFNVVAE